MGHDERIKQTSTDDEESNEKHREAYEKYKQAYESEERKRLVFGNKDGHNYGINVFNNNNAANYENIWDLKLKQPQFSDPNNPGMGGHGGDSHWKPPMPPSFDPLKDFNFDFNNQNSKPGSSKVGLYLAIFIPISVVILLVLAHCCWRRRKRQHYKKKALAANEISVIGNHYLHSDNMKPQRPVDPWEIRRENVVIRYDEKLGSGAFADVYVAELIGNAGVRRVYNDVLLLSNFHDCEVAVKMLPPFADETSKNDFQKEITFMKSLKYHPHLVCLLGYVPDAVSPLLVIEYCANGDLLHFIRERKSQLIHGNESQENLKVKNLVSFAWQISNGLEYLISIGFIHRDVAARNVLLDKNNVCKIGDFGLCRIADSQIYTTRGGKLPVRWMSIESLKSFEFSMKSDVWAYGILLFELFSFGEVPYPGLENSQILEYLEAGKRLHRPAYCTDDIYEIMSNCWEKMPGDRRSFAEICLHLMRILENANSDYGYVDAIEPVTEIQVSEVDEGVSVI